MAFLPWSDLNILRLGAGVAILALVSLMFMAIYNAYLHPLAKYPGPVLCAASKLPYVSASYTGNLHTWIKSLHDCYGDTVRIAPDKLSFIDPQAWKDIYGHRKANQDMIGKDRKFYMPEANREYSLLTTRDLDEHATLRRVFAHAFSDRALRQQEPIIQRYANQFIQAIKKSNDQTTGKEIDLVRFFNYTTFDIMADLTFGEPLGMLRQSEYTPWVSKIFARFKYLAAIQVAMEYPIVEYLIKRFISKATMKSRMEHLEHTTERVDRRMEKSTEEPDIWNLVLTRQDFTMSRSKMVSNASLFMVAGTETTATLLSGLTFYLLKNPDCLRKVQEEIRALPSESDLNLDGLPRLKYLAACLEEAFRMYPPVPIGLPRVIPKGGSVICGKWIPSETRVSVPQFAAYRSTTNFKDPESFIPERWLPGTGYDDDRREVVQPFSVGSRNCLGKNLAWHELRLIFAKLVWNFDLELDPRSSNWASQNTFALWEKHPLLVKARAIR